MENKEAYHLHDRVVMKKAHPCGGNKWEIIRTGMDIKIKCMACGRIVMLPYSKFIKGVKRRVKSEQS
jgi:hypothetical protein